MVLCLSGGQVESLFDLGLPVTVAELPADLAALDELLDGPGLLTPIEAAWDVESVWFGRPTVPMDRFVRLMVIKARTGWGYETLVREVSDSLHLRRFCRIALCERVPDESTVRKLVRRLGPEVVEQICARVIAQATAPGAERRFVVRAARIDSAVVEADIRIRPISGSPKTPRARWRAKPTARRIWPARGRPRSKTARGRCPGGCAGSTARSRDAPGRARSSR
jgi:hypothetical protein